MVSPATTKILSHLSSARLEVARALDHPKGLVLIDT
jgi:hypothetical protein